MIMLYPSYFKEAIVIADGQMKQITKNYATCSSFSSFAKEATVIADGQMKQITYNYVTFHFLAIIKSPR
jgi:hypothetical protein